MRFSTFPPAQLGELLTTREKSVMVSNEFDRSLGQAIDTGGEGGIRTHGSRSCKHGALTTWLPRLPVSSGDWSLSGLVLVIISSLAPWVSITQVFGRSVLVARAAFQVFGRGNRKESLSAFAPV